MVIQGKEVIIKERLNQENKLSVTFDDENCFIMDIILKENNLLYILCDN
jgi:hypothetical protein